MWNKSVFMQAVCILCPTGDMPCLCEVPAESADWHESAEPDLTLSCLPDFGHDCWETCVRGASPLIHSQAVMVTIDVLLLATSNRNKVVEDGRSIPHKAPQVRTKFVYNGGLFTLITGSLQGVLTSLRELTVGEWEVTQGRRRRKDVVE